MIFCSETLPWILPMFLLVKNVTCYLRCLASIFCLFPHLIEHDRNAVIVLSRVFYDLIMTNDNDNANQQAKERLCPLFIKGSLHMYSNQALCFKSLLSQRIIHPVCSFFQYLVTFIYLTHWHFYSWVFFLRNSRFTCNYSALVENNCNMSKQKNLNYDFFLDF